MQEYRAYIMGPDGLVQSRIDIRRDDEAEAIRLAQQLLMFTTWSYGNWTDRSRRSGLDGSLDPNRPSGTRYATRIQTNVLPCVNRATSSRVRIT
jgi:hypothetical protein